MPVHVLMRGGRHGKQQELGRNIDLYAT